MAAKFGESFGPRYNRPMFVQARIEGKFSENYIMGFFRELKFMIRLRFPNFVFLTELKVKATSLTCNSDHRPLCLFSGSLEEKFKRCFKFEEGWTRDERSKLVVDSAWKSVSYPWALARVFKKIGAARVALMHWNRAQFGKIKTLIKDLERRLNLIRSLSTGSREWTTESGICHSLNEARMRKELYWKQRARVSWLKEGDKCSKFFFLSETIRGRRNVIESILNKGNMWITKRELIDNEFMEFFKGIFIGTNIGHDLNCNYLIQDKIS
ncbi:uncharacterized protein LOC115694914 [Cannabis sativa]|uniref:uncharacterized protein LOC115694914 n=1 Tax=Cannabis sativa TaxID=3483 RepID=UPI0011DF2CD1|nr:uncharacterized protein LOC115694914 [Cannabis sativa]